MKIKSQKVLDSFDSQGLCEGCGIPCSSRERHHIFGRGAGGPDFRCNIIMLGDAFTCHCHLKFHNSGREEDREIFLIHVARRDVTTPKAIREVVNMVRNKLPGKQSRLAIEREIEKLSVEGMRLAMAELEFVGVLS